ncbi:conserved protein of unknown function [Pseudomonas marincola]|uniref:Uncharacterized protein n=1 Tax=Pseudomonas marincola TaxID=437900 RepID=A0A653DXP4_9PSED|nr:conserved protein of unknown function [Pseudomonas marincola]
MHICVNPILWNLELASLIHISVFGRLITGDFVYEHHKESSTPDFGLNIADRLRRDSKIRLANLRHCRWYRRCRFGCD